MKRKRIKTQIIHKHKFSHGLKKLSVYIPSRWTVLIVKRENKSSYTFYLTSVQYYFKLATSLSDAHFYYCFNTGVLSLMSSKWTASSTKWISDLNNVLYLFSSFIFFKLKFKGKGYYIYKNYRNTIAPQFGYYHRIYIYSFYNKVKFLSKTKILIFGLVKQDILKTSYTLKSKRSINIFTGRGVRFSKQIVYKKTGKVSSYR